MDCARIGRYLVLIVDDFRLPHNCFGERKSELGVLCRILTAVFMPSCLSLLRSSSCYLAHAGPSILSCCCYVFSRYISSETFMLRWTCWRMVCLFENQFQSLIASLRASHHADSTPRTGVGKDGGDRCQACLRTTRAVRVHCAEARLRRQVLPVLRGV